MGFFGNRKFEVEAYYAVKNQAQVDQKTARAFLNAYLPMFQRLQKKGCAPERTCLFVVPVLYKGLVDGTLQDKVSADAWDLAYQVVFKWSFYVLYNFPQSEAAATVAKYLRESDPDNSDLMAELNKLGL